jgi:hypothetical protein
MNNICAITTLTTDKSEINEKVPEPVMNK